MLRGALHGQRGSRGQGPYLAASAHRVPAGRQPHRHSLEPAVVAGREDTAERERVAHCHAGDAAQRGLASSGVGHDVPPPRVIVQRCGQHGGGQGDLAAAQRRHNGRGASHRGAPPRRVAPWCGGGRSDEAVTGTRSWVMPKQGRAGPAGSPAR